MLDDGEDVDGVGSGDDGGWDDGTVEMTMVLNGYDGDYIDGSDEVVMMIIVIIMIVADGNGW